MTVFEFILWSPLMLAIVYPLNRAAFVVLTLCRDVGGVRKLWRVKRAEMNRLVINHDSGAPFLSICRNTKQATFAVLSCPFQVLRVHRLLNIAQVCKAVVMTNAVDMVKLTGRPFSVHIKPRKTVRLINLSVNSDAGITVSCDFYTSRLARFNSIGRATFPLEYSSFGVVVKKLAQTLRGKIGLSHDALQLLIGQRPGSVSALAGPRHFIRSVRVWGAA